MMKEIVAELAPEVGVERACETLAYPRSSYYRQSRQPKPPTAKENGVKKKPPRSLSDAEKEKIMAMLNSEQFMDCSPRQMYGSLLDEGVYLCSVSTMYRLLHDHDEVRERRNQKRHPAYAKPELLATAPNQVWTWDITKLRGPVPHTSYYLYVILDMFSRYVVGYMIAARESAVLAKQLVTESCAKQEIEPDRLILHADRGSAMISKSLALLLSDLGVLKSHSRPYVSNDNCYSEAQFKTMKYRPDYPNRFASLITARDWALPFFNWYNNEHRHTGLGLMTPTTVHHGLAAKLTAERQVTLSAAYEQHPERFVKGPPAAPQLPQAVWINPPPPAKEEEKPSS